MVFPPPKVKLTIFDTQPTPTVKTFQAGIPAKSTSQQSLAIILYSPNLQLIASLDNTKSAASSTYESSVTTGFTFSSTQSISITEEVGVNIEVVSASVSVTFALSFTEEWSTEKTTSMSFTCPPGDKSFVYQGTLVSQLMVFDASNAIYSWSGNAAKALTQILVTSNTPIGAAPSNPVSIRQLSP
jgi:hypothetical protein